MRRWPSPTHSSIRPSERALVLRPAWTAAKALSNDSSGGIGAAEVGCAGAAAQPVTNAARRSRPRMTGVVAGDVPRSCQLLIVGGAAVDPLLDAVDLGLLERRRGLRHAAA